MRRREFIAGLAVAAGPLGVRAQSNLPVVGYLAAQASEDFASRVEAFRAGLSEVGYVEGQNVRVDYCWGMGRYDQLPSLAADLVARRVKVIAAVGGSPAALAAKAATAEIPIVFEIGADPVALGLVSRLNRPGGNLTGVTSLNVEAGQKRLEILHELVPHEKSFAALVNPAGPTAAVELKALEVVAASLQLRLREVRATNLAQIESAFEQLGTTALVVIADPFFTSISEQLASLATRHKIATIHPSRRFVTAGGLVSYGGSYTDSHRIAGTYVGRILRGEAAADLPVQQTTKIEMAINLRAAKVLGIEVPSTLSARADDLIE